MKIEKTSALAKSPLLIQKEKELKDLEKKKSQLTKNIKTTKTKIDTLQTDAETASKETMNHMLRVADLSILTKEIRAIYKDLFKKIKLSKKDRAELEEFVGGAVLEDIGGDIDEMFENSPFGSAEDFVSGKFREQYADDNTDEFNRQRRQQIFEPFAVKPNEAEQQQIRKIFLELANQFHPDKAANDAEHGLFPSIMQRINAAYQRGDIDELLDIKTRYVTQNSDDDLAANLPILDILDAYIFRIKNEIDALDGQMTRLKMELDNLKKSDMGALAKSKKKSPQHGESLDGDGDAGLKFMFDMMNEVKTILTAWLENGKKPLAFNQFVDGSHPIVQRGVAEGHLGSPDDDDDDLEDLSEQEILEMMQMFQAMMNKTPKSGSKPNRRKG